MKLNVIKTEPTFTPVRLEWVIETQRELDTMHSLFNYSPFCDAIGVDSDSIRTTLKQAGADTSTEQWHKFVSIMDRKK